MKCECLISQASNHESLRCLTAENLCKASPTFESLYLKFRIERKPRKFSQTKIVDDLTVL